ncbi:hypothetical protein PAMP_021983 [Pampus punctatissimus]
MSSQGQKKTHHASYKWFRRQIMQRSSSEGPAASTPLSTGRWCEPGFEFDAVCQRLELDSPPRHHEPAQRGLEEKQGSLQSILNERSLSVSPSHFKYIIPASGWPFTENVPEQVWAWTAATQERGNTQQTGSGDNIRSNPQPFAILNKTSVSLQGKSVMKLAAPSLLNDYYSNLLDCSCNGMIALALGSSVYLWNSETRTLVGHFDLSPQPGRWGHQNLSSISSLCWSRDGRALCIGIRQGQIQLWDVEHKQKMRCLSSHMSVVRALAWKQQLLSSGSVLGRIHHHDLRAPEPLVGAAVQQEGLCSLQWSPGNDWLASGSTDGLLHIWDSDIAGSHQPITTMKQPSAVKAMGWCPWQRKMIATGGGWKDRELRIWDTQSATCVTSADTNSQICSLRWAEKTRRLVTGHGLPHHHIICWDWECPSLSQSYHLTGHSLRVLHLALNPVGTQIFSAGADQCLHIWDI